MGSPGRAHDWTPIFTPGAHGSILSRLCYSRHVSRPSARPLAVAPGSVRAVITPFGEKPGAAGREITDANSITLSVSKRMPTPARIDIEVGDSPWKTCPRPLLRSFRHSAPSQAQIFRPREASPARSPDQLQRKATPRARDDLLSLFAAIETAAAGIWRATTNGMSRASPAIRLVSSLAEGSDQLAAEIVAREFRARADEGQTRPRAADWSIDAILPAPKADYVAASRVSALARSGTADRCRRSISHSIRARRPAGRIALADP